MLYFNENTCLAISNMSLFYKIRDNVYSWCLIWNMFLYKYLNLSNMSKISFEYWVIFIILLNWLLTGEEDLPLHPQKLLDAILTDACSGRTCYYYDPVCPGLGHDDACQQFCKPRGSKGGYCHEHICMLLALAREIYVWYFYILNVFVQVDLRN